MLGMRGDFEGLANRVATLTLWNERMNESTIYSRKENTESKCMLTGQIERNNPH